MSLHTFDLVRARPRNMAISILSGGVETGRSLAGDAGALDFSGGGLWSVKYQGMNIFTPAQHKYMTQLQFLLNSRARTVLVPILTDWIAPVPGPYTPGTIRLTVPHSDGTPFSDGSLYSQPSIVASLAADAALNAGTLQITVLAGDTLYGGEIFSIEHPTKNHHAYGIQEVDAMIDNGAGSFTYTVGITPPLREAATAGTSLKFDRPLCLMRLYPQSTLSWDVEGFWKAKLDIAFLEAL